MKTLSQLTALLLLVFTISCGGEPPVEEDNSMMEEAMEEVEEVMDDMTEEMEGEDEEDANEREIPASDLPEAITTAISEAYADYTIDEAEEVTADDGTITYEVELKKGEEEIEVMYSAGGEYLGMEEDEDEMEKAEE